VPGVQQALTERLVNETRTQIEPKVRALQASMAKHLGLPPPSSTPPAGGAAAPGMPGNRGSGK